MRRRIAQLTIFTAALSFAGFMLATSVIAGILYRPIYWVLTIAESYLLRKEDKRLQGVEIVVREDIGNGGEW